MQVADLRRRLPKVKRDMDLLRDILLKIEDDPKKDGRTTFYISNSEEMQIVGHSEEEFFYHLQLLIRARLIDGSAEQIPMEVRSLTWEGHEFVDNIRNDNIWDNTKKRVGDLVGSLSVSVIAALAEAEAKKFLGLSS
jgi:hypothetical protein